MNKLTFGEKYKKEDSVGFILMKYYKMDEHIISKYIHELRGNSVGYEDYFMEKSKSKQFFYLKDKPLEEFEKELALFILAN